MPRSQKEVRSRVVSADFRRQDQENSTIGRHLSIPKCGAAKAQLYGPIVPWGPFPPNSNAKRNQSLLRNKQLKIFYAVGPGDVVALYRDLLEGRKPAFQPGMAFSKQFLDWCDEWVRMLASFMAHAETAFKLGGIKSKTAQNLRGILVGDSSTISAPSHMVWPLSRVR